jgi:hypothetical protein
MRRADAIMLWHAGAMSDVTDALGDATSPITFAAGDALYVAHGEWLSGLYVQVDLAPAGIPTVAAEMWDAATATWKSLPVQEKIDQVQVGHVLHPRAYDFTTPGVIYWGTSQWLWVLKVAGGGFPENAVTPVDGIPYYWVRLRNVGTVDVQVARVLPNLYNTYATHQDVAHFLGLREEFTDVRAPLQMAIRRRIRQAEDWVENYTRKSWRLRAAYNERYVFNPFGVRLKNYPVWYVTHLGVWAGSSFADMREGRNQDFWVSNDTGMVYFTRILYGRGLPWSSVATRYLRAPDALQVDYIYGFDFDMDRRRDVVSDIVIKRVAAQIVDSQDWVAVLTNNPDTVPKAEKARAWKEEAEAQAAEIRSLLVV